VQWQSLRCQVSSDAREDWLVASPRFALFAGLDSVIEGGLSRIR